MINDERLTRMREAYKEAKKLYSHDKELMEQLEAEAAVIYTMTGIDIRDKKDESFDMEYLKGKGSFLVPGNDTLH